jgi:POT family proton-dependent oligopeptide transporter
MYIGLSLLIIGCGLMKPAISAMVGEFFKLTETGRKDASFAIFYMSINIGGFLGPMIGGVVQEAWGYDYAFAMAALGLAIGIINFSVAKNRSLKDVGNIINKAHHEKLPWTALEKKKVFTYILLCITNIFWNIIYVLPYGLLTLYAEKNIDRHLGSFTIPATWYYGMYGLLIIIYSPIVATMYQWIKNRTGSDMTLSWKLAYGYILVAGGCVILLPLVKAIGLNPNYVGSSWYIIGFYTLFCFSELLTLPVMLSAATTFAPHGFSATLVSLNMAISWAIGAWLGGEFGAWTQETNPVVLFWWLIALCLVFAVGHILSNKKIEKIMHA